MTAIWRKRTVGIVLTGFEGNPHELAKTFDVLSEGNAKGDPLYSTKPKPTCAHNRLHFAKELPEDGHWGDALGELIGDMGGVSEVASFIDRVKPEDYSIVINVIRPAYHVNGFEPGHLQLVQELDCELVFNFFDNE